MRLKLCALVAVAVVGLVGLAGFGGHLGSTFSTQSVSAQAVASSTTKTSNLGVSPALKMLVVKPKQTITSYKITITNDTEAVYNVVSKTTDFTTFGTSGNLVIIDAKKASKYGLARSITLNKNSFKVGPHQAIDVTVTIKNINNLTAGGHYGALLFKASQASQAGAADSKSKRQVGFDQTLASLVFLTTSGKGKYDLQLAKTQVPIAWFGMPSNLNLVFSNSGNVQTAPRGYLNVTDPFGKQVAHGLINDDSGLVLPETRRLFQAGLKPTTKTIWPGKYTLNIYYRSDASNDFRLQTVKFWYFNPLGILIIGLIVAALIGAGLGVKKISSKSRTKIPPKNSKK